FGTANLRQPARSRRRVCGSSMVASAALTLSAVNGRGREGGGAVLPTAGRARRKAGGALNVRPEVERRCGDGPFSHHHLQVRDIGAGREDQISQGAEVARGAAAELDQDRRPLRIKA